LKKTNKHGLNSTEKDEEKLDEIKDENAKFWNLVSSELPVKNECPVA